MFLKNLDNYIYTQKKVFWISYLWTDLEYRRRREGKERRETGKNEKGGGRRFELSGRCFVIRRKRFLFCARREGEDWRGRP